MATLLSEALTYLQHDRTTIPSISNPSPSRPTIIMPVFPHTPKQKPTTNDLETWALLNNAQFNGVKCADTGDHDRGSGLIATRDLKAGDEDEDENEDLPPPMPLIVVPRELVLSLERVGLEAKSDRDLRELLEVLGGFVSVSFLICM
jgi:hypothetical protein